MNILLFLWNVVILVIFISAFLVTVYFLILAVVFTVLGTTNLIAKILGYDFIMYNDFIKYLKRNMSLTFEKKSKK